MELSRPRNTGTSGVEQTAEKLAGTLDDLLERYLNLLHQYQTLQNDLSRNLSTGYFSLTQANFSSPRGLRYGQDYYDERMQSSVSISVKRENPVFSIVDSSASVSQGLKRADDEKAPAPPPLDERSEDTDAGTKDGRITDPLKWFGILVPPTLRSSQRSFKGAVREIIPALASTTNEMKEIEIEVRRTRKRMRKALREKP